MPTITAASPPGRPPGRRTLAVQLIRMMPSATKAIQGTSHIWNTGRIEMNAIEMPASVPSIAARGVYLRMVGPTNTPSSTITPMMNAQASPACQARIGSLVLQVDRQHDQEDDDEHVRHARAVGHRGDVAAPLGLGEAPGEVGVVEVADRQRDAERRQDAPEHDVLGQLDHAERQPGQHDDVEQDVGEQPEERVPVARHPEPGRARTSVVHVPVPDPADRLRRSDPLLNRSENRARNSSAMQSSMMGGGDGAGGRRSRPGRPA